MAVLRLVGAGIFILGEPPNNQGWAKTKGQTNRHCENTPEFIHIELKRADRSQACKARLSGTNELEPVALQPARAPVCPDVQVIAPRPLEAGWLARRQLRHRVGVASWRKSQGRAWADDKADSCARVGSDLGRKA